MKERKESFVKTNDALKPVRLHGKANSVPLETLPEGRDNLREIIGCPPNMTLATGNTFGTKQDKTRITVLLACNATGNDKLQPLVVGKTARPQCFRQMNMKSFPLLIVTIQGMDAQRYLQRMVSLIKQRDASEE
ncbi:3307_t:CDS:2 [Paraglomus brasilianum]|uniref:3307_t:CDS:1 n=1 Tax=Paraglomus brasilianum TaxID=144538 RepID=A0A9N9F6J9_9GLOM|nr:3307_t:CDS:2 [Paraglomus brasilianum]